ASLLEFPCCGNSTFDHCGYTGGLPKGESGGVFNIASGHSTSVNDLIAMVLEEYGSALVPQHADDLREAKAASHSTLDISVERAKKELGWSPQIKLCEGIHRLRIWMEAQGQ